MAFRTHFSPMRPICRSLAHSFVSAVFLVPHIAFVYRSLAAFDSQLAARSIDALSDAPSPLLARSLARLLAAHTHAHTLAPEQIARTHSHCELRSHTNTHSSPPQSRAQTCARLAPKQSTRAPCDQPLGPFRSCTLILIRRRILKRLLTLPPCTTPFFVQSARARRTRSVRAGRRSLSARA